MQMNSFVPLQTGHPNKSVPGKRGEVFTLLFSVQLSLPVQYLIREIQEHYENKQVLAYL